MITKRIIACLDIANGMVVKGVKFRNHEIIGEIVEMAEKYSKLGIDELIDDIAPIDVGEVSDFVELNCKIASYVKADPAN